ncbi:MAG: 16S rRNA processing protein RimM [Candidatus Eisenbacteria bacterium]|uniref:Ribosome maturation factor RimM n=1 Tax=Eiseniibacteriota bacterium TaxID=2212470 RepID=A0A849SR73_UNCEI|nr:16S rRNA processing protein RimM [Candidatus Eisenbacteria bacterium]
MPEPGPVRVGRLGRPHGLNGEIILQTMKFTPDELRAIETFTWRSNRGATRELKLRDARAAHDRMLLTFEGIGSREKASALTLGELWVDPARLPDPGPDTAYEYHLVGCEIVDEAGARIGTLLDVVQTAAHPLYRVSRENGAEALIPAVEAFVRRVDLDARRIVVALPEGLLEI